MGRSESHTKSNQLNYTNMTDHNTEPTQTPGSASPVSNDMWITEALEQTSKLGDGNDVLWRESLPRFVADACAERAEAWHSFSDAGIFHLKHVDRLVIFNNHPIDFSCTDRDEELREVQSNLERYRDDAVLAKGECASGYSLTMLLSFGFDDMEYVSEIVHDCAEARRNMYATLSHQSAQYGWEGSQGDCFEWHFDTRVTKSEWLAHKRERIASAPQSD